MPLYTIHWDNKLNDGVIPPNHTGLGFYTTKISAKSISEFKEILLTSVEGVDKISSRCSWELDPLGCGKVQLYNKTSGEIYYGWIEIER